MVKKLLFLCSDYERGGIPRVTLNLVKALQQNGKIEPSIFCGNPRGMFREEMRKFENSKLSHRKCLRALTCFLSKEHGFFKLFATGVKLLRHSLVKLVHWDWLEWENEKIAKKISSLKYDAVVATSEGLPSEWARNVIGSQKIMWVHNDYAHECPEDRERMRRCVQEIDTIICVAEHVRKAFITIFPEFTSKTVSLYNIVNDKEIMTRANEDIYNDAIFDTSEFSILSIGRYNERPKHFSIIPQICSKLVSKGFKQFHWYLIGSGSPAEKDIIINSIRKFKMEERVILLGERENPYPYLRQCSLFALTSRYEAYPTVINEALALGTPIITTNFDGVEELVSTDMATIAPIEQFSDKIEIIMKNTRNEHLGREIYDFSGHNQSVIEKFEQLIR